MARIALPPLQPTADHIVLNPECIEIELTNLCNLTCTTCARNDFFGAEMKKGSMPFENMQRIVDEVTPFARKLVLIGLGETLLYKRLIDTVDYIQKAQRNTKIALTTNATIPNTPEILQAICEKLQTSITFSIDGIGETYNAIRRGANYQSVLIMIEAILRCARASKFKIDMVVVRENYQQMRAVVELAHTLGISTVYFNTLNLAALPHVPLEAYDLYSSDPFHDALRLAHDRARQLGVHLATFDFESPSGFRKCRFPWEDFYITWDGFLAQCCAQPFPLQKNFGNVFEKGVMACINSPEFIEVRKMWSANRTPVLCERCHKVKIPSRQLTSDRV
jgi:MoaA/NifB/PqqE/SkfB family radical SAM enzyme